jgi:hypothetical protein
MALASATPSPPVRTGRTNGFSMIFGFNTDIASMGTVYHVQTEVRAQAAMLESQVFVKGRCVAKRSTGLPAGAEEEEIHALARTQHRELVEAIRSGTMRELAVSGTSAEGRQQGAANESAIASAAPELKVEFLGARRLSDADVIFRFRVLCGGSAASGAEVWACCVRGAGAGSAAGSAENAPRSAVVDGEGVAELRLAIAGGCSELELRARLGGQQAMRRFLLKSAKA